MKIMIKIQEVENNNDAVPPPQVTRPDNVRPTFIPFNIAKEKVSLSNISEQVKKIMEIPLPTLTNSILPLSTWPPAIPSPTESNIPHLLNTLWEEETEEGIKKALKKFQAEWEEECQTEVQKFANTKNEDDQQEDLSLLEIENDEETINS